ncbi:MAG: AAA family ATPase, partial [Myxococcales bacterium]|nr:AAA family ATPase [Myxococcales bacterium]
LHDAGKVHRDVKPTNVRVTGEGHVVLLDFGLVTEIPDLKQSMDSLVVGTVAYMAPEQAASGAVGPAADVYALGVMLYEIMTGRLPHEGSPLAVLVHKQRNQPEPPSAHVEGLPTDLEALCMSLLAFDPAERPSGEEILRLLGAERQYAPSMPATVSSSSSSMRPPFLGRDEEVEAVLGAFESVCIGARPVSVFVRGESGVGKTQLIRHCIRSLEDGERQLVLLGGRCYERESVPYKAFDGVIDSLSRHLRGLDREAARDLLPPSAAWLPKAFPVLGRVEGIARLPAPGFEIRDPLEIRNRVFRALRELLRRIGVAQPLVIAIDDLQWADADSLLLLRELLREPEPPAILLLISTRDLSSGPSAHVGLPGEIREVLVGRLPEDLAERLAETLLERTGCEERETARAIAQEAMGHPLYIDALVRYVALGGLERPAGLKLHEAVWARAVEMGPSALRILQVLALAGTPMPREMARVASGIEAPEFNRMVAALRVAQLLRGARKAETVEPYHDRVREAVDEHTEPGLRAELHLALAEALEGAPAEFRQPELLLRHLEAAGERIRAARYAEQAAERASATLAFGQAAAFYGAALRLADPEPPEARRLRLAMAGALANAGRLHEAAEHFLECAEGAEPSLRLECQRQAAHHLLTSGYLDEGLRVLDAVRKEMGIPYPRTERGALASLGWHRLRLRLRGHRWTERHESQVDPALVSRWEVLRTTSLSLAIVDNARAQSFQTQALLLALGMGERRRALESLLHEAAFICSFGGSALDRSREIHEAVGPLAQSHPDPRVRALVPSARGIWLYFHGRFMEAAEALEISERIYLEETVGGWAEMNIVRSVRLMALARAGRFAALGRQARRALADAIRRGDRYGETTLVRYANAIWWTIDEPEQARARLAGLVWKPPEGAYHIQHYFELIARADLLLYEGEVSWEAFEALEPEYRAFDRSVMRRAVRIAKVESYYQRARLALAAGRSDPARAARLVRRCVRRIDKEQTSFGELWSTLLNAGISARLGEAGECARLLRCAIEQGLALDAPHLVAVARLRLGARLGEPEGASILEEAERWMQQESIRCPERFAEVFAPGFD